VLKSLGKTLFQCITAGTTDSGGEQLFRCHSIPALSTIAEMFFQLSRLTCVELAQSVLREQMLVCGPVYVG
jgi:hypothetical protein